jgi:hypothetical protein
MSGMLRYLLMFFQSRCATYRILHCQESLLNNYKSKPQAATTNQAFLRKQTRQILLMRPQNLPRIATIPPGTIKRVREVLDAIE